MSNSIEGPSVGAYMKKLWLIYSAISAGVIIIITLLFSLMDKIPDKELHSVYTYLGIGVAVMSLTVSIFLFKSRLKNAPKLLLLSEKLSAYQSSYILLLALLEGAVLVNILLYYISGNGVNFIIGLIMLIALLSRFPSRNKIATRLQLSDLETGKLMRDENIID